MCQPCIEDATALIIIIINFTIIYDEEIARIYRFFRRQM